MQPTLAPECRFSTSSCAPPFGCNPPCLHRPLSAGSLQTWMHHPLGATDLVCTGPEPVLYGLGCITPSDAFNHTLAPPSGYQFSRSPGASPLYVDQHEMIGIQAVVHPYFLQLNHFLFLFSFFFFLLRHASYPLHRCSSGCLEHDSTNAGRTLVTLASLSALAIIGRSPAA